MLGIYIRSIADADAQHLMDVDDVSKIDDVLRSLKKHGVYCDGQVRYELNTQYIVDNDDGAYFEVIVS